MEIFARVSNDASDHRVLVGTDGHRTPIAIPQKPNGRGSGVNGGELLFAALATCFCNDLYREADRRGLAVRGVEVEVTGAFGAPGEPARNISYRVRVQGDAPPEAIDDLVRATDAMTEIQNTLRAGCPVRLVAGPPGAEPV